MVFKDMIRLRSILAFNMKAQRQNLGITQAQLAERVNTSTHYVGMIETEKKFPTPEMLERIATALEIEPPALFATTSYPQPEFKTLAMFQKQILSDVTETISVRFRKFEVEHPENPDPNGGTRQQIV
jgi:transcriptional regulator with XRE-family HTH domain